MSKRLFINWRVFQTRLLLVVALVGCLVWLALSFFRGRRPDAEMKRTRHIEISRYTRRVTAVQESDDTADSAAGSSAIDVVAIEL